jgi:hypothetical protein
MTEIDVYRPRELAVLPARSAAITERDVVDGWVEVVTKIAKLADMIADTDFVPKALRSKPAAITACMLTGREIGVGPMLSMKVIHMVNGTPSLAAEYKRGRALQAGHEIVYDETTITRCVVRGRRKNEDSWVTVMWTIEDARRAKLAGKDVWQQNPRRMLEARATGELCDLKFPDCSWGLATTEALQDGDASSEFADAPAAEQPAIEAPAAAPRTAQRRTRTAAKPPAETPSNPVAKREDPADGLPPLPGEDEPDSPSSPASSEPEQVPPFDRDAHGSATRGKGGQLTALWTILSTEFGFGDDQKEQARVVVEQIVGRDLDGGTTGDLSYNEARAVLDTLSNWIAVARERGETPHSVLIAAMVAADQAGSD